MNGKAVKWIVGAILVLALAVVAVLLGMNLLPSKAVAEKGGTVVPWMLTWVMILITSLSGVVLAYHLIMIGTTHDSSSH